MINLTLSKLSESLETPALRQITQKILSVNGINLGQGTCQVPAPVEVINGAYAAMKEGISAYTNPRGLLSLRAALAKKLSRDNNIEDVNPETDVIVTCGATGALEGICQTFLNPGDEVVLFEPSYPYHRKVIEKYGAKINYVKLRGDKWNFTDEELQSAFTPKTRFVIINTPSNPSGKVFSKEEILKVGRCAIRNGSFIVTDEIYEYMVFDDNTHVSPASLEELRPHTFMIGGYSKTFAITGWRIGFLLVPSKLTDTSISDKITQALDLMYICAPAPLQEGAARAIEELDGSFYKKLKDTYRSKRDFFCEVLQSRDIIPNIPSGAYYIIADYSKRFPDLTGMEFVDTMIQKAKVGAVPSIDFVRDNSNEKWVRFCVAVEPDVLEKAAEDLKKF